MIERGTIYFSQDYITVEPGQVTGVDSSGDTSQNKLVTDASARKMIKIATVNGTVVLDVNGSLGSPTSDYSVATAATELCSAAGLPLTSVSHALKEGHGYTIMNFTTHQPFQKQDQSKVGEVGVSEDLIVGYNSVEPKPVSSAALPASQTLTLTQQRLSLREALQEPINKTSAIITTTETDQADNSQVELHYESLAIKRRQQDRLETVQNMLLGNK